MQEVCLIIPFYNEESRFPVEELLRFYETGKNFAFCLVDDGSSDGTLKLLKKIQENREDRIRVISLEKNKGKAEAVRAGILESLKWREFSFVGYLDADLSAPLAQMQLLLHVIKEKQENEFIFGSRVKLLGKKIERVGLRHYAGRFFSTLSSLLLKLPVYDTQCGAKLFSTRLAKRIFTEEFLSSWLFDVELFARIIKSEGRKKAEQIMLEVPLEEWRHKGGSKIKLINLINVPFELFRIHLRYRKYL